jgi:hypothetical protein
LGFFPDSFYVSFIEVINALSNQKVKSPFFSCYLISWYNVTELIKPSTLNCSLHLISRASLFCFSVSLASHWLVFLLLLLIFPDFHMSYGFNTIRSSVSSLWVYSLATSCGDRTSLLVFYIIYSLITLKFTSIVRNFPTTHEFPSPTQHFTGM